MSENSPLARLRAGLAFTILVLGTAVGASVSTSDASPSSAKLDALLSPHRRHIEVTRVVPVTLPSGELAYIVALRYQFPHLQAVRIDDLGLCPPAGSFRFITARETLVFRGPDGALLSRIQLRATLLLGAKPPLQNFPAESNFPPGYRAFEWQGRAGLTARLNAALNQQFKYQPYERDGISVFVTTYAPLDPPGAGVFGQIALRVSFPYNCRGDVCELRVQSIVEEGRQLSDDFRPTNNLALIRAGDRLVEQLVATMRDRRP